MSSLIFLRVIHIFLKNLRNQAQHRANWYMTERAYKSISFLFEMPIQAFFLYHQNDNKMFDGLFDSY